jgi:hypothetical protein
MISMEELRERYPDMVLYDDFDECIIGITENEFDNTVVCYDIDKMIDVLIADGLSYEDARDHFEYNIAGMHIAEHTPILIESISL